METMLVISLLPHTTPDLLSSMRPTGPLFTWRYFMFITWIKTYPFSFLFSILQYFKLYDSRQFFPNSGIHTQRWHTAERHFTRMSRVSPISRSLEVKSFRRWLEVCPVLSIVCCLLKIYWLLLRLQTTTTREQWISSRMDLIITQTGILPMNRPF